jgi:hypothetical protein
MRSVRLVAKRMSLAAVSALVLACSPGTDSKTFVPRPIQGDPRFAYAAEAVQALADIYGEPGKHHFCIVGIAGSPNAAWVHWREGKRLTYWTPMGEDVSEDVLHKDLILTADHVRLDSGVVDSEEEIGTSTYLVTRAWANAIIEGCQAVGEELEVVKRTEDHNQDG